MMNEFLKLVEPDDDYNEYIRWRDGYKRFVENLGLQYPKIEGDYAYPSAYDEYIGRGYDLRKIFNDFKEAD